MNTRVDVAPNGAFAKLLNRTEEHRTQANAAVHRAYMLHIGHLIQRWYATAAAMLVESSIQQGRQALTLAQITDAQGILLWPPQTPSDRTVDKLTVQQVQTELLSAIAGTDPRMFWREHDTPGVYRVDLPHPEDVQRTTEGARTPTASAAATLTGRTRFLNGSCGVPAVETAGVLTSQHIDRATRRLVVAVNADYALPALCIPGTDRVALEITLNGWVLYVSSDELPFRPHHPIDGGAA